MLFHFGRNSRFAKGFVRNRHWNKCWNKCWNKLSPGSFLLFPYINPLSSIYLIPDTGTVLLPAFDTLHDRS